MADERVIIRDKLTRMGQHLQELEPLGKRYYASFLELGRLGLYPFVYRNVKIIPSLYRRYISYLRHHLSRQRAR